MEKKAIILIVSVLFVLLVSLCLLFGGICDLHFVQFTTEEKMKNHEYLNGWGKSAPFIDRSFGWNEGFFLKRVIWLKKNQKSYEIVENLILFIGVVGIWFPSFHCYNSFFFENIQTDGTQKLHQKSFGSIIHNERFYGRNAAPGFPT